MAADGSLSYVRAPPAWEYTGWVADVKDGIDGIAGATRQLVRL